MVKTEVPVAPCHPGFHLERVSLEKQTDQVPSTLHVLKYQSTWGPVLDERRAPKTPYI